MLAHGGQRGSAAAAPLTVKLDETKPVVTLTGVTAGASYSFGFVPAIRCATQSPSKSAGECYRVGVIARDGTAIYADFVLR